MVGYWGQDSLYAHSILESDLIVYCQSSTWDIIVLSFITGFTSAGVPTYDFANHWDMAKLGQDIVACQALGVKLMLSIGGAYMGAATSLSSTAQATTAATQVWNMFGGGTSTSHVFGTGVAIDGVDLDLENAVNGAYYSTFVQQFRSLAASAPKPYYVSAAPQCPYPDASLGPAAGKPLPATGASLADWVWVQFYNNPYCQPGSAQYNIASWAAWAQGAGAKLFIGMPGDPVAAGSGYLTATQLRTYIDQAAADYPTVFAGVMTWDAGLATYSGFGPATKLYLNGKTCAA